MNNNTWCAFCGASTAEFPAAESVQVGSIVREFSADIFTVWRCVKCGSLHAQEPIDYDRCYRDYPMKRMKYDFVAKTRSCANGRKFLSALGWNAA